MRALIKLGGTLLDDAGSRTRLARELTDLADAHQIVVVHGGGKQMTRFLAERGVESRFVDGLRVTTPEVVDALLKVFAGSVNHELVAALVAAGARAVGLSGIDARLATAEQMDPRLGAVGRIADADATVLDHLTQGGFLPVVACVAGGRTGEVYNVNADQMAVACAAAFRAEALIFLTDVDGVRDASGSIAARLSTSDCARLIEAQVATGGMQAKLTAAGDAIAKGVTRVTIAPGARDRAAAAALSGLPVGTAIHA
ncbi:MAG: acetylglutamate kinase [Bryobacteraceae bacterium]|nr:acetylglutamate kinase [Bryobacteraceae bacterium]